MQRKGEGEGGRGHKIDYLNICIASLVVNGALYLFGK